MKEEIISPSQLLRKKFKFEPTFSQAKLFTLMDDFLDNQDLDRHIFILKGYAGTGKTTFISALIKTLPKFGWKSVLLAPTGRASKVMANYSKRQAQTIHRKIYKQKEDSKSGALVFERQKNYHEGTLFIVDEASMINDKREFGRDSLLHDIVTYVFEGEGNKLMLIGDEAQLPPVGLDYSPALDAEHVAQGYYADVVSHQLTEVVRQKQASGILENATLLRNNIDSLTLEIGLKTKTFPDIFRMTGERIEQGLNYAYDKHGRENTIVITRSNKNAVQYNQFIRNQINFAEYELQHGDILMAVKNNYTVLEEGSAAGFIANGEFLEITHLGREEEMHGFRFQEVGMKLVDYPDEPEFETLIMLDTLHSHSPSLTKDESNKLYESVMKDYFWVKSRKERNDLIKADKYMNALQVKYAYALTCHKSQGGQWDAVFVDQGYLPNETVDLDFMRWLYTAITRGVKEVFLVNFNGSFFAP